MVPNDAIRLGAFGPRLGQRPFGRYHKTYTDFRAGIQLYMYIMNSVVKFSFSKNQA